MLGWMGWHCYVAPTNNGKKCNKTDRHCFLRFLAHQPPAPTTTHPKLFETESVCSYLVTLIPLTLNSLWQPRHNGVAAKYAREVMHTGSLQHILIQKINDSTHPRIDRQHGLARKVGCIVIIDGDTTGLRDRHSHIRQSNISQWPRGTARRSRVLPAIIGIEKYWEKSASDTSRLTDFESCRDCGGNSSCSFAEIDVWLGFCLLGCVDRLLIFNWRHDDLFAYGRNEQLFLARGTLIWLINGH